MEDLWKGARRIKEGGAGELGRERAGLEAAARQRGGSCLRPCQVTNAARGRGPGDAFWRQALELSLRGAPARIGRERGGGGRGTLGASGPRAPSGLLRRPFPRAPGAERFSDLGRSGAREHAQGTRGRACGAGMGGGRCVGLDLRSGGGRGAIYLWCQRAAQRSWSTAVVAAAKVWYARF